MGRQRSIIRKAATVAAAIVAMTQAANAQYYTWGSDPTSLKWSKIKSPNVSLIYPDTVDGLARRTLLYINSIKSDIDYGFLHPALDIPFVMHPENFSSNGMVMWLPKRIEFLTSPAIESYSMPWIKQLVAHEYRHAVQYNNLNRGVVRVMSYILGQQGSSMGLLFLPLWVIEGDAVMSETQMSTFGRGLQPSFTMEYRAVGRDMLTRRNLDRWFCGSYRTSTPDHYHLGYQAVSWAYTKYDKEIWSKVARFGVRNPYYIATVSTALKKYYGENSATLVRGAFKNLFDHWESLPERENSAQIVTPIDTTNYTTYSHPIPHRNGKVIAMKRDYERSAQMVEVDGESGAERRVTWIGDLSTRPSLGANRVWWSEYRSSTLFDQRVNSQLCYVDLDAKHPKAEIVKGEHNLLYPTAMYGSDDHMAYVEYTANGQYTIVEAKFNGSELKELRRTAAEFPTEIHGLAWDDATQELYFIATDNSGMWLGARDSKSDKGYRQLRKGAYISLSDLSAGGGKLYFGSIESGYDEMHSYDIASGEEARISESTYGSFDPSAPKDGAIYGTTYDRWGYHISRTPSDRIIAKVTPSEIPQNIVNPERVKWDVINLDTVDYTLQDSVASHKDYRSKRYNKTLNLVNIHSWMPMAFNPFELAEEQRFNMSLGATLISQNLLSSAEGYASYGYNSTEGSVVSAGVEYTGLGFDLSLSGTYGGNQVVYDPLGLDTTPKQQRYYSVSTGATLPLLFDCGHHTRLLALSGFWNYSNGLVVDLDKIEYDSHKHQITNSKKLGFSEGLQKLSAGISYSDYTKSAKRDPATPWGWSASAMYALSPNERNFSDLISITGRITTRGLGSANSISLKANYQTSIGGYKLDGINLLSFQSVSLLPRGFSSRDIYNHHYIAGSANYQLPLWHPEGGIGSILYFRRIRFNAGFDVARFEDQSKMRHFIYSYGGEFIFDINTMRMPEAGTSAVKLSIFRNNHNEWSCQFGVALPI